MQNAQPSIPPLLPSEISPEMAERLAAELPEADLTKLKDLMAQQRKLDSVREVIMARMEKANSKMERDAQQLSVREKCQLVGEVQECLYELQLYEHASKVPLLEITKIFFSHNPKRCLRKDASPTKQKPPKRRKNELGGLISNSNIDFGKKFSAREAKLLAASQVQQQNDGRTDEFSGKKGSGGQTAGRLTKRRTVRAVKSTPTVGMSPVHSGWLEREEYQGAEAPEMRSMAVEHHIPPAEEDDLNLVLMHSPSPLADESPLASLQRTDSTNNVASATSQMHSPPGTRSRKKGGGGKGENQSDAGSTGGKSPRKRSGVVERQRHGSGTRNASAKEPTDELDEEEQPIPADEPTYCLCEQVSFGEMICCDYELCSVEWFHFACVNIKSKPKGKKWFCPLCRYNDKANLLKPELHQKLEQMRRREGQ